ncbi:MAG: hypothetical protein COB02_17715 [Candidatus Cloacimonadota bacterium]|nr:MAG: hypothetical protein COB02_17715 [Candidatus Cloacimonadota bacterium]
MKNIFNKICKFAICSSLALSISSNSFASSGETEVIDAIRNCIDPAISQCKDIRTIKDELRGKNEDGSYKYFKYEKSGDRSKDNNENLDTDEGMYTVKHDGKDQAIYKVVFHLPKSRGIGKDNTLMRLDSYEISYTPFPDGNGPQNIVIIKKVPKKNMTLDEEITVFLENVGTDVKVQAKVYAQKSKRSWGLNPDPNFEIKLFRSAQIDDPSNPDAELLAYAKKAQAATLKKMGVPSYEIPPSKVVLYGVSFKSQKAMYRAQDVIDRAANAQSPMRAVGILEGSAIEAPYSVSSLLKKAISYLEAADQNNSELAKTYGKRILDELNRASNQFSHYTDQASPGYGDIKDGYGDSDVKPGYGNDSDTKPGYGGGYDSDVKPGYGNGHDTDGKPGYGSGHSSDTKPGYGSDTKPGNGNSYNSSSKTVSTLYGNRRYDSVSRGTAIDNKNGRISYSEAIKGQIRKDQDVMDDRSNGISNVKWYFFPKNGKVGPTDSLRTALQRARITIVIKSGSAAGSDYKKSSGSFYDSDLK